MKLNYFKHTFKAKCVKLDYNFFFFLFSSHHGICRFEREKDLNSIPEMEKSQNGKLKSKKREIVFFYNIWKITHGYQTEHCAHVSSETYEKTVLIRFWSVHITFNTQGKSFNKSKEKCVYLVKLPQQLHQQT